ncbi:hypothetical protein SAMN05421810_11542 [Amycolatopsis arida]|uniref:Integral membrane protein n=1 Tax=Amycolatopsis arida TaxID=587909 RepID=A0A1I6AWX7_9PSEU|nr:hypothetical protein CLV69_11535 [Amycolatopsis arida]SFQ73119.1 hypothetical protein SAMN05421810_11542 [Amycolatopsis arida]
MATGALGVLLLVLVGRLDALVGIPAAVALPAGVFAAGYAVAVWLVAARPRLSPAAVTAAVVVNVLWVAHSVLFVVVGAPTTLGTVLVLLQAAAVLGFAALQATGLRRLH